MTLDAAIGVRVGDFDLDIELVAGDGEVVALLGPNGAGKSTAVRALAGLERVDRGRIVVDARVLDDPAEGVFVPSEHRPVSVVFQDYLLFPRLSARDNVAFGLRARGTDKRTANARALDWLERFGLADLAALRPAQLSGGQAQRVALARALATDPHLLLLDEPLAALDATTRVRVRSELRRHLATFDGARVLVTHDPIDALVLADRLVIVEDGRITQTGTPAEVTARPASSYVADLVGINLLTGRLAGDIVSIDGGGELTVAPTESIATAHVAIAIRPQAVAVHLARPDGSPRNAWEATIADVEPDRDRMRLRLAGRPSVVAEVTVAATESLGLVPGTSVWASVKATDVAVYPR